MLLKMRRSLFDDRLIQLNFQNLRMTLDFDLHWSWSHRHFLPLHPVIKIIFVYYSCLDREDQRNKSIHPSELKSAAFTLISRWYSVDMPAKENRSIFSESWKAWEHVDKRVHDTLHLHFYPGECGFLLNLYDRDLGMGMVIFENQLSLNEVLYLCHQH